MHYYLPQRSTHTGARTHNHRIHSPIQPSTTYCSSAHTHIQRHVAGWRQHDTSSSPRGSPDDPARQRQCAAEFLYTQKGGGFAGTSPCSVSCCCGGGCVARHARFGAAGMCGTHETDRARASERERLRRGREGGRNINTHRIYVERKSGRTRAERERVRKRRRMTTPRNHPDERKPLQIYVDYRESFA